MLESAETKLEVLKGSVSLDETGQYWEAQMDRMLVKDTNIIALRGAGSFNGISKEDANILLEQQLIPRVQKYIDAGGRAAIIYDGDNDDPDYPDIGHIMGRLRDHFRDRVDFYAVQMTGWYKYRKELPNMRPLHSAHGNEYMTVLFPDKKFEREHDYFSQNQRLAQSPKYEQWYVGACGQIASAQLADYSGKVGENTGVHKAVIFRAPVSIEQEQKIRRKIAEGIESLKELEADAVKGDFEAERSIQGTFERGTRLTESITRRAARPYGLLCDEKGEFIQKPEYRNLEIEVV